ncbi:MAG TPA: SirA family protein [Thermoanaerobacterales bacterium]|jgi:tRNA 2-thiouridine synthesizing protein A|nr:SirA family protein [Thermoanaerobacterales bacterium]
MWQEVDARGLSCPQPVVLVKKAMETSKANLEVLVDNTTARDNIVRFSKNSGCKTDIISSGQEFIIKISR